MQIFASLIGSPRAWASAAFGFLALQIINANIRKLAQEKGWDNLLVRLLSVVTADWETTRARWWLWFLVGASGGVAAILWYSALYPPPLSAEAIKEATAPLEAERDKLAGKLQNQALELTKVSRDRELARQQLTAQKSDNDKIRHATPLSQDDVQFRNDLRNLYDRRLWAIMRLFVVWLIPCPAAQTAAPAVSGSEKPRADAAYRLLQGPARHAYEQSWTKLYEASGATIDTIDVGYVVGLLNVYFDNYREFASNFHDFLIITGPADDKFNLLPKLVDLDGTAQHEFESLKSYPNSAVANSVFPAHLEDAIRPFVRPLEQQK
jgi:hypothetical protein